MKRILALLVLSAAGAQDWGASQNIQSSSEQGTPALSASQAVITNQDVIGMLKAGLSPEIVAAKIKNSKCQCDTSPAGLATLKASGVPDSVILAMVESASPPTEKPQGLAAIKDAKSVYLVNNAATDTKVFDNLPEKLKKWGRWTIAPRSEEADVLLVFSANQVYLGTMSIANVSGTGTYASGTATSVPLMSMPRFLIALDRASGRQLATVSCERRMSAGYTAGVLVNRMRELIEKSEKVK